MPNKFKRLGKWTGQWQGQVKHNGQKYRSPLVATKEEAKAWEMDAKKRFRHPAEIVTPMVCLVDWINKYLDYALRYRPDTYSEKKNVFKRFVVGLDQDMPLESIKVGLALEHLQGLVRDGRSPNKGRKNLGAAWEWGKKYMEGFPTFNPFLAVEAFPKERRPRYVPTERDFRAVLAVAEGEDQIMLLTFLHTAGRRGEIFGLRWDDVDFARGEIQLWTRKRKGGSLEGDRLPMTDELHGVLLDHRQGAINEWVFTQPDGRCKGKPFTEYRGFPQDLCLLAGVKPFGLHAIRHLTASILAGQNVPMVSIQAILRHHKLATTERYIRGMEPVRPYLQVLNGGLGQRPNIRPNTLKAKGSSVSGA